MHLPAQTYLHGGKYKIIEKIGQGGFGIAYKAYHTNLQREVCIKEFFFSDFCERTANSSHVSIISTSAEKIQLVNSFKRKFIKEGQRLAKFQHANIVQVLDNFEENNTAYIVMEYVDGGSLEELISRTGKLTEQKTLDIILPIIDALVLLHKNELLHLDIKPANIMLRKNHSPVLIDFGISKYTDHADGKTQTTSPVGVSKGYAPIEQYGGIISDFTKATDVYSLCATIYKMLTGITPPEPLHVMGGALKSPRSISPHISTKIDSAIIKGLSTKVTDRFESVSKLKTAIGIKSETSIKTILQEKVESKPKTAKELFISAEKKRKQKDFKAAIEDYSEAIKLKSTDSDFYFYRAMCKNELEDYDGAIQDYTFAIKLEPDNSSIYNNRGASYSYKQDFSSAVIDFFRAFEIDQEDLYFNNWILDIRKISDTTTLSNYLKHNWTNKDQVYYERGLKYCNREEYLKAADDFLQAYKISNDEKHLEVWITSNDIEFLKSYLEHNLPNKNRLYLQLSAVNLSNNKRKEFRYFLNKAQSQGNSTAENIKKSIFLDNLILFFMVVFDIFILYMLNYILQNKLYYFNSVIMGVLEFPVFVIVVSLIWSLIIGNSVSTCATIINPGWVRFFKRIHLFLIGLVIASGFIYGIVIFLGDFPTDIFNIIGIIFLCVMLLIFSLLVLIWSLVAISGNDNDWLLLEKINNEYTICFPHRLIEYFKR